MAQFVTHIQPTLLESAHHHHPHPHPPPHSHQHQHHHEKHYKDVPEYQGKEKHISSKHQHTSVKLGHSYQHFPILPATPTHQQPHEEHHVEHHEHKRDSGHYLDSHGVSHVYQMHFIDSQGIHRDFHGIPEDQSRRESQIMEEIFIRKAEPERSPYEKSPCLDEKRAIIPPQSISLHNVCRNTTENKHQTFYKRITVTMKAVTKLSFSYA